MGYFILGDQLVQDLRQNHISPGEKIDLALRVLLTPASTTLPNLEEFLLEWCTQQLIRSAKLPEGRGARAPYLDPNYYELLLKLIPGGLAPHFIKANISRLPFVPVISRLLDQVANDINRAEGDMGINLKLMQLACQALAVGKPYMESTNPDWVVNLALSTLTLVHVAKGAMYDTVLDLLTISLSDLTNVMLDQLLLPISRCRHLLTSQREASPKARYVVELLDGLLGVGLFHPNHVLDYANLVTNPAAAFYRQQLFKGLQSHSGAHAEPILALLPVLFDRFIKDYSPAAPHRIDFDFAWELVGILRHLLAASPGEAGQRFVALSLTEILEAVNRHAIYVPSNEPTSQAQLARLREAYQLLKSRWQPGVPAPHLLRGFCALVSIDYCVVDADVEWLWGLVAAPEDEEAGDASHLGLALLREYGKARQLDRCFMFMTAAFDAVSDFTRTLLCQARFATGFRAILEQLGSAAQARQLLTLVIDSILYSSSPKAGTLQVLTHLVMGLPLPLPPAELDHVVTKLVSTAFAASPVASLTHELTSLTRELAQLSLGAQAPASNVVVTLHLLANLQDRWPRAFLSEPTLAQIVAWCRQNLPLLSYSASLPTSWELPLVRLVLQQLEAQARACEGLSSESVAGYFDLPMFFALRSLSPINDGVLYTLLGPYLPIVGKLMPKEPKAVLVHLLISDLLDPRCSPTSAFHPLLDNARFYEVPSLRKLLLDGLFNRVSLCFVEGPLGPALAEKSLHLYLSCGDVDLRQLDRLHGALLIFTHIPPSYLNAHYRSLLLSALFAHQKLLERLQDTAAPLQPGWEISLALVCDQLTFDAMLIRQYPGYIRFLLDAASRFLAKLSYSAEPKAHLLTDQLVKVVGSGISLALSLPSESEVGLEVYQVFDGNAVSVDCQLAQVIWVEVLSQVLRAIGFNLKLRERLRHRNIPMFHPARLDSQWRLLTEMARTLAISPSQITAARLRGALALVSLTSAASAFCPGSSSPASHLGALGQLLALCHHHLSVAPSSCGATAILEGGIELHAAMVTAYPAGFIPDTQVLPTLASLSSLCKVVVALSTGATFSDLSTGSLRRAAAEFLARVNAAQWDRVLASLVEHLLTLPEGEGGPTFLVLNLLLDDAPESFRKTLAASLSQVVLNLVQLLTVKADATAHALATLAKVVRRPEYLIPQSTLGPLLACLGSLPRGDIESETLLGQILGQIMRGHSASLASHLPTLVTALVRAAQYQTIDMGVLLQNLPSSRDVPGIQHHVQYLLLRLIQLHQPSDDPSAFAGWFHCFDILQPASPESLLGWLSPTHRYQLKRAHQAYDEHHRFTGKRGATAVSSAASRSYDG
ncbi:hypothetical protein L0F63_004611 [Massospora cicadina]|nr:hypothetical protein L0F63_004611 [Massospora cicadina]